MSVCPLLYGMGVDIASCSYTNGLKDESKNWEKELCEKWCPRPKECLEAKGQKLTKKEAIAFAKALAINFRERIKYLEDRIKELEG